jgi:hypothetical protein
MRSYTAIIKRCQDTGLYVGFIPGFQEAIRKRKHWMNSIKIFGKSLRYLKYGGLANFGNGVRTSSFPTLMACIQQYHFMRDVMCRLFCFGCTKDIGLLVMERLKVQAK